MSSSALIVPKMALVHKAGVPGNAGRPIRAAAQNRKIPQNPTTPLTVPALLKDREAAGAAASVTSQITLPAYVKAPLQAGDIVGKITYSVGEVALEEVPLVAVTAVDAGSGFKRLVDKLAARFF